MINIDAHRPNLLDMFGDNTLNRINYQNNREHKDTIKNVGKLIAGGLILGHMTGAFKGFKPNPLYMEARTDLHRQHEMKNVRNINTINSILNERYSHLTPHQNLINLRKELNEYSSHRGDMERSIFKIDHRNTNLQNMIGVSNINTLIRGKYPYSDGYHVSGNELLRVISRIR